MEIVIYELPELKDTLFDSEKIEEHKRLMQELGINPDSVDQPKSPCPYPLMDKVTRKMFELLLPDRYELKDYNRSPIPLEVLRRLKHAQDEEYFDKIFIRTTDEMPDPVAIGMRYASDHDRNNGYTWNAKMFLIARWGDVVRPFSELWERATKVMTANRKDDMQRQIEDGERELRRLDAYVRQELGAVPPFDLPFTVIKPGETEE